MPPSSYPGVYIEELPGGTRTIVGVPTSVTAFVGRAWRGPVDDPVTISSYAEYERQFGGLWRESAMSYAVQQFFVNGGLRAVIVRVMTRIDNGGIDPAAWAMLDLGGGNTLAAAYPGTWGRNLDAWVDHDTGDEHDPSASADDKLFNLTLFDNPEPATGMSHGGSGLREIFKDVSLDTASPRFVTAVLAEHSLLARVTALGAARPAATPIETPILASSTSGSDGDTLEDSDLVGASDAKTGIHALSKTDIFNLLCLPPLEPGARGADVSMATWTAAAKLCAERRAFLIVDAPADWDVAGAVDSRSTTSAPSTAPTPRSTSRGCASPTRCKRTRSRTSLPAASSPGSSAVPTLPVASGRRRRESRPDSRACSASRSTVRRET